MRDAVGDLDTPNTGMCAHRGSQLLIAKDELETNPARSLPVEKGLLGNSRHVNQAISLFWG